MRPFFVNRKGNHVSRLLSAVFSQEKLYKRFCGFGRTMKFRMHSQFRFPIARRSNLDLRTGGLQFQEKFLYE
jgi:hypothetical protein